MVRIKRLIIVAVACAGLIGCTEDSKPTTPTSSILWPLAVGNYWTSRATATLIDTLSLQFTVKLTVDSSFVGDDGETWFGLSMLSDQFPQLMYYRYDDDGLHRLVFSDQDSSGFDELYLKYPCDVGEKWILSDGTTVELMSDSDRIEVPAGKFSGCMRYIETAMNGMISETVLYPGVGPVLMNFTLIIPFGELPIQVKIKAELIDYLAL